MLHADENRPEAAEVALQRYLGLVQTQANPSQRGLAQAYLGLAQVAEKRLDETRAQEWLQKIEHHDDVQQVQLRRTPLLPRAGKLSEAGRMIQNLPDENPIPTLGKLLHENDTAEERQQNTSAHKVAHMGDVDGEGA